VFRRIAQFSLAIVSLASTLAAMPQAVTIDQAAKGASAAAISAAQWDSNDNSDAFRNGNTLYASSTSSEPGASAMAVSNDQAAVGKIDFTSGTLPSYESSGITSNRVPEPSTLILLGAGLIGFARLTRIEAGRARGFCMRWPRVATAARD
jgi:PEP-CTERM motif